MVLQFELFKIQPNGKPLTVWDFCHTTGLTQRLAPKFIRVLPAISRWPFGDPKDPYRAEYLSTCSCKEVYPVALESLNERDKQRSKLVDFVVCSCMGRMLDPAEVDEHER